MLHLEIFKFIVLFLEFLNICIMFMKNVVGGLISKWRPITFLSVSHNILAKVIDLHIHNVDKKMFW
jgi:hypothetical protein